MKRASHEDHLSRYLDRGGTGHSIADVRAGATFLLGQDPERLVLQNIFQMRLDGFV